MWVLRAVCVRCQSITACGQRIARFGVRAPATSESREHDSRQKCARSSIFYLPVSHTDMVHSTHAVCNRSPALESPLSTCISKRSRKGGCNLSGPTARIWLASPRPHTSTSTSLAPMLDMTTSVRCQSCETSGIPVRTEPARSRRITYHLTSLVVGREQRRELRQRARPQRKYARQL